jgi:arylsulfatase A-like enzyme
VDDAPEEQPPAGWSAVFPHPLDHVRFLNLWQHSPSADEYLARLATAAVDSYKLGGDDRVDYLGVSFSTLDIVGHAFGPDSHEVQDILAHLDGTIGRLLSALDERVGRGSYVVALTADHGVAPIPEQAIAAGLSAGRVDGNAIVAAAEAALVRHLGKGPHTAGLLYTDYYFLPGVWDRLRKDREALAAVKTAVLAVPGVGWVFTADELRRVHDRDPAQRAAALSWFEGRSGDLIVIPKQYWISSSAATTHGTLHPYDQRVPLIFYGPGIPPGMRSGSASPADVAPTLAAIGGVRLEESDGRALPLAAAGAIRPPE